MTKNAECLFDLPESWLSDIVGFHPASSVAFATCDDPDEEDDDEGADEDEDE